MMTELRTGFNGRGPKYEYSMFIYYHVVKSRGLVLGRSQEINLAAPHDITESATMYRRVLIHRFSFTNPGQMRIAYLLCLYNFQPCELYRPRRNSCGQQES